MRTESAEHHSGRPAPGISLPACLSWTLQLSCAALLALLLLGYHPDAEDGGIYAAAVEARLNPALFPHDHVWVTAHTRFALFVPLTAAVTGAFHLPAAAALFVWQVAGVIALLAAAAHLARTCFPGEARPWLATLAVAIGAGLPVAGTALYAVDPYCTARTLTTPLLFFALSLALRRQWTAAILCWSAAASLHPLMALWGALPLLLTAAHMTRHPRRWIVALTLLAFAAALLLQTLSPPETAATRAIAHTRAYWFPAEWRWYEWAGAAAPCLILAWLSRRPRAGSPTTLKQLATVAAFTTALATALALCFVRETAPSLAVARLQPLRGLHLVFVAFLVAGGGSLQARLRTAPQRTAALAACLLAGGSVFAMQRSLFPHTPHLEWPGRPPVNPWEAAFAWCRSHTPPDALFALDADYIHTPGEDSHGFRALALRSALPDGTKDAGIAAVLPNLTPSWETAVPATRLLDRIPDRERRERLLPLGVTWLVLPVAAQTALSCPFHNAAAQVCLLEP